MDEAKILAAIHVKYRSALEAAATTINTMSKNATPIWRGNLRDAKSVRVNAWNDVDAISGDSKTASYVETQYNDNLRHKGDRMTAFKPMSQGAANSGGMGEQAQYARAHRAFVKSGAQPQPAAKWYDRVIKDAEMMRRIQAIFANKFRAA